MKWIVNSARIIVGVLFIFSGLIKANDPLGLSYKMQEFFEVWGWSFLSGFTLALSILMIVFEIVAGVAVLLGWKMKVFSWLLLLLILFFSFLTGYAVITGSVRECGCFGDCIPLQAGQSFAKDLILLFLILLIFFNQKQIRSLFGRIANIALLFFATVSSFAIQWYVLQHLPMLDCLPYKAGGHILQEMKIPAGAIPDSTVISFVYTKDGKEIEFTADQFPADFNDSAYHFVRRYDKLIRKGNAEAAIKDFSLTDSSGADVTQAILSAPGPKLLLFLKDEIPSGAWSSSLASAMQMAQSLHIPAYAVTNLTMDQWQSNQEPVLKDFLPLRCDVTAIKTAARSNPTLYLLDGDRIVHKWGYADFGEVAASLHR